MNMVPLILVLILAVCSSSSSMEAPNVNLPCSMTSREADYNNFLQRHVIHSEFNRKSLKAWEKYMKDNNFCSKDGWQTFMENSPDEICTSDGRRSVKGGDLCISKDKLHIYKVHIFNDCKTIEVKKSKDRLVVGCDKVNNKCLPVHLDSFTNDKPGNTPCV